MSRDPHLLSLRTGRWRWPWAILGTVLASGGIVASIVGLAATNEFLEAFRTTVPSANSEAAATSADEDKLKLLIPGDVSSYAAMLIAFLPVLLIPMAIYRFLHGRAWNDWPYRSDAGPIRWREFLRAAAAFLLVVSVGFLTARFLFPARFQSIPRDASHLPWVALGLAVVFVQAFAEEVAFKGYLYRVWGAVFPYRWPLIVVLSAAFTSLHWDNVDFARDRAMAIVQFMVGSAISFWLYVRTQSLAAPTGLHWANNVFAMLILASAPGDYGASAFAIYTDPVLAAGRSNLTDPEAWIALVFGNLAFMALVGHHASPLFIPRYNPLPPEATPPPPKAPIIDNSHPVA